MRSGLRDPRGQVALFDGFLFFVIMVFASVLVLVSATTAVQERIAVSGKDLVVVAHETRDAYMSATIPVATYRDRSGSVVYLYNYTVLDLLVVELSLIDDGLTQGNFENSGSVNAAILVLGERFLGEQRYHFAVFGGFGDSSIELFSQGISGRAVIPFDRVTSSVAASMTAVGKQGQATIELYVWV